MRDLRHLEQEKATLDFLFFWGHRARGDAEVGRGCLSQWWPATFTVAATTYTSAEHYMMHQKALLFGDHQAAARILAAPTQREAKAVGRQVHNFDDETWEGERYGIVVRGNTAKFEQDEALRRYLLSTGQQILAEASPNDAIWGIGLAADDQRATKPSQWRGLNLLGFALMDVRARLTSAAPPQ